MPTYDYFCKKCDKTYEFFQSMSDAPIENCSICSGKLRRLVSGGTGLIFKGSGFYLTDYAKNNSKKSAVSDSKNTKKKSKKNKSKK
tara:strand:- start:2372 stop:2629 length:258 start_codon:yes stop_codon:yes gene_type:complete